MTTENLGRVCLGVAILCAMVSGVALAGDNGKGCSLQGTWFGVESPENRTLTGWFINVMGQSNNEGTNNFEYPTFDVTVGGIFPAAVGTGSTARGVWKRTGGNTFAYSFMTIAVDNAKIPVWIGEISGTTTLSSDCSTETITASMAFFDPATSPFDGEPLFTIDLPEHYGYRYELP